MLTEVLDTNSVGQEKIKDKNGIIRYRDPNNRNQFISKKEYYDNKKEVEYNTKIVATFRLDYKSPRGRNHYLFLEAEYERVVKGDAREKDIDSVMRHLQAEVELEMWDGMTTDPRINRSKVVDYETSKTQKSTGSYGGEIRWKWKRKKNWEGKTDI